MKYHIINKSKKENLEHSKDFSFDELLDFFRPNFNDGELDKDEKKQEVIYRWEDISSLSELRDFIEDYWGSEKPYAIEVEPEDLDILIKAGWSKKQSEQHLKRGTTVFEEIDLREHFSSYLEEMGFVSEDEKTNFRQMLDSKKPMVDWGVVEFDGKYYFVEYVL